MSYTLNNMNLATLDTLLQSEGVDPFGTGVNSFLIAQGDTKGVTDIKSLISVMTGTPPFPTSQPAQVDNITTAGTYKINTDQFSALQAIILDDTGGKQRLTVTGHSSILVATGNGNNVITLADHGNDLVNLGTGSNTVTGGAGTDSIFGDGTHNSLTAGSGNFSLLYEGGSHSTLVGGTGTNDILIDGPGADNSLVAGHSNTLIEVAYGAGGGTGATLDGGSFDVVTLQGGSGGGEYLTGTGNNDVFRTGSNPSENVYAGGNDASVYAGGAGGSGDGGGTLLGGGSNDQFHIGAHGNDTIIGAGAGAGVVFDNQAYHNGAGITITPQNGGVTTVNFTATGQNFTILGVQTLTFSDGHVIHL